MDQLELRALPLELGEEEQDNTLSGIVNVPGSQSEILTNPMTGKQFREVIEPGTFAEALEKAKSVDFLYQHDKEKILSTTDNQSLELTETNDIGLVMRAKITQTSWGKDAYQMIKDGIVRSMSFGMHVLHDTWQRGDDGIPLRTIDKINLIEVSAVRNPAYAASAIEARGINITAVEIPDLEERDLTEPNEEVKIVDEAINDEENTVSEVIENMENETEPVVEVVEEPVPVTVSLDEESRELINSLLTALKLEKRDDETVEIVEDHEDEEPVDSETDSEVREDEQAIETKDEESEDAVADGSETDSEKREMTESEKEILEFFG